MYERRAALAANLVAELIQRFRKATVNAFG
jgi:hypothetical protein